MLAVDALGMRFTQVAIDRDPNCEWCATRTRQALLDDYAAFCGEAPPAESVPSGARDIRPADAAPLVASGDLLLLDVREDWEVATAAVAGALHVPMSLVPARQTTLPRDRPVAVLCHHGMRSAMVAEYLRSAGHPQVLNVTGGIDRWSVEVDPQVPRY